MIFKFKLNTFMVIYFFSLIIFILGIFILLPAMRASISDHKMPDSTFFLTKVKLDKIISTYSQHDKNAYIQSKYTYDLSWPLIYTNFFFLTIIWLEKINVSFKIKYGRYIIFFGLAFDLLENILFAFYINHLDKSTLAYLGIISQYLKWIFICMTSLYIIYMMATKLYKIFLKI